MRFMIIVKATSESEAGAMPSEQRMDQMAKYHEDLARAGVLLDASGLAPSSQGWRIQYGSPRQSFIDGPFAETKEIIAGYTLIQVKSRDEAIQWTQRFPNPAGEGKPAQIEVRRLFELEDFQPNAAVERFRALGAGGQRLSGF